MAWFKTCHAFADFEREVRSNRRYIHTAQAEKFLSAVRESCKSRRLIRKKGTGLWRAQIGHASRFEKAIDGEIPCAYPSERMLPLKDRALEGRANPKGIPVLYLGTEKDAVMSEVRPWVGSLISLGRFEAVRLLSLVECFTLNKKCSLDSYSQKIRFPEECDRVVWSDIDRAFSRPTTRSDDTGEYIATQILAEVFRDVGFDGVGYRSAFGRQDHYPRNIALFDLTAVKLVSCSLFRVGGVSLRFDEADGPYWIRKANETKPTTP